MTHSLLWLMHRRTYYNFEIYVDACHVRMYVCMGCMVCEGDMWSQWYNIYLCSVGQPKHSRVMAGGLEGEYFFGSKAEVRVNWF